MQVPQVSQFSVQDQLHGHWILELQKTWKCENHHNENGGAGACYYTDAGVHYTLNNRRLKLWAAAIVS